MRGPDFADVTEQWGMPMPPSQVAMAYRRYRLAAEYASGRDLLEIGCGSGFGLDYLARHTRSVVGGDLNEENLKNARKNGGSLRVLRFDAHQLPFASGSFDVVALFEVIYYLDAPRLLSECSRILRPEGSVVLCLPNPDAPGFHRSPFSTRYFSVPELAQIISSAGFRPSVLGGFPVARGSAKERLVLAVSGAAQSLGLVPKTLSGRSRIKRLVYGKLDGFAGLRDGDIDPVELVPLSPEHRNAEFRNLYAVAHRGAVSTATGA